MMTNNNKPKAGRIDFISGVPETLFKKVNGKCSVPRCKNPTVGPFYETDGAVNMGTACHIYSAAKNGPRGRGGKSEEFISSEKNGIWCCSYHGFLIDKKKGVDYPAENLFAWKALAEARILKLMNDIPSPLGWVESIEFLKFPVLDIVPKTKLSRRTLLWSKEHNGKTSLYEVAASITRSKYAERFCRTKKKNQSGSYDDICFKARIIYSTVDAYSKEVDIEITGNQITRKENEQVCLLPPGDVEVIYCSEQDVRQNDNEDDIDFMMRVLNVDKVTLFVLAKIGTSSLMPGKLKFEMASDYLDDDSEILEPVYKENGEPYFTLWFKGDEKENFLSFGSLCGTEQSSLILELLITKAREIAKQRLTLLLIDSHLSSFDPFNFKTLLTNLEKEEFQVVVTLPSVIGGYILESSLNNPKLRALDYLNSWQLSEIGS
ncbi:hypothetical protein L4D77_00065 [Photobacterium frigidiphilum]|uniref:hypothetical protein n=1 Tax=Photobacterium frigidiphilum TaxID=264736 RepID=UPI003D0F4CC0